MTKPISTSIIDRVAAHYGKKLYEVPVGFKWFVDGLRSGETGFGGEESAGASFLRRDGSVWTTDKDGIIMDLLAAEIMAKTGQLVLDNGKWQGRQIVSENWVKESTQFQTKARHGFNYGYRWWLGSARYAERQLKIIFGSGTGGQKLFIITELDMVVVVMSKVFDNKGGQERATRILTEYVLPSAFPKTEYKFSNLDVTLANAAVGKYYNASDKQSVRIGKSENALYARPIIFSQFELRPLSRASFYGYWGPVGDIYIDFIDDEKGEVIKANIHYLLGTRSFKKIN